jgi:hypothetical protein
MQAVVVAVSAAALPPYRQQPQMRALSERKEQTPCMQLA